MNKTHQQPSASIQGGVFHRTVSSQDLDRYVSVTCKYTSLHFDNHFDYYRCIVLINIYAILTKVEVIILDICQVFLVCFFTARDEVATMDS